MNTNTPEYYLLLSIGVFLCLLPFVMVLLTYYRIKCIKENTDQLVAIQHKLLQHHRQTTPPEDQEIKPTE